MSHDSDGDFKFVTSRKVISPSFRSKGDTISSSTVPSSALHSTAPARKPPEVVCQWRSKGEIARLGRIYNFCHLAVTTDVTERRKTVAGWRSTENLPLHQYWAATRLISSWIKFKTAAPVTVLDSD
jgi:hypothetical protein